MRAWACAVLGIMALATAPANAATIGKVTNGPGAPMILVQGDFAYGDGERFEAIARTLPKATVVMDSPGGNLMAGLKIGETMRARGYTSLVPQGAVCASACAIAWLGGTKRYLSTGGRLGFHAASNGDGVSGPGNALVGAYMAKLGLSEDAVYALTAASPYEIAWLDLASAKTLGISVESWTGPSFGGGTRYAAGGRGTATPVSGTRSAPAPRWSDGRDRPAPRYSSGSSHDGGGDSGGNGCGGSLHC